MANKDIRQKRIRQDDESASLRPWEKNDRRIRINKLKLIGVILLVLLALVGGLRIRYYLGSISKVHLNDEGLTHAKRFKDCFIVHGIDVSEFQDDTNWRKVKSSGADFAFIRAGYRSKESGELREDADFKDNMKKAKKAGIMKGVYFFSQAVNKTEAVEEAEYLLGLVKRYDIEMPLVIDFELLDGGRLQEAVYEGELPNASDYHDIVLAFCNRINEAGYEAAVYANYDMLTNYMDSNVLGKETTIWAAQYGGECNVWGDYMYWQCADDAFCEGVKGKIDHDIWYIEPGKVYETKAAGKKEQTSIGDCKISFDEKSYTLKDNRAEPKVTVMNGDKKLRKGKDYILSFVRNTETGTGYAIVRGVGRYKDWTSAPFTIE